MDKQELQPLKGFRDFLPDAARKRAYALNIIKETFEIFGFEPLETPALERQSLLLGKYGVQADKLVYKFQDEGKRDVGLRYDQTVPTARVIAASGENLGFPFKRYQIQPVWRAEKPQKGRFREFLQCDIDTFGTTSPLADAEIITAAIAAFKKLGFAHVKMLINSRILLMELITQADIPDNLGLSVVQSLDKLDKLSPNQVRQELLAKGIDEDRIQVLFSLIDQAEPNIELQKLTNSCLNFGVTAEELAFAPTLARGLDYYTGTIFELISADYPAGSLAGGGRYDRLIGQLTPPGVPAVGIALGFDRLIDAMEELKLFPTTLTGATVMVASIDPYLEDSIVKLVSRLRQEKIKTTLYFNSAAKLAVQLRYAAKKGIPYMIILGSEEVQKDMYTLRDMATGGQETLSLNQLLAKLK